MSGMTGVTPAAMLKERAELREKAKSLGIPWEEVESWTPAKWAPHKPSDKPIKVWVTRLDQAYRTACVTCLTPWPCEAEGWRNAQAVLNKPKPLPGWDHPVDGDGLSRWTPTPPPHDPELLGDLSEPRPSTHCAWISPEGWSCTASELEHDGAWELGHHFTNLAGRIVKAEVGLVESGSAAIEMNISFDPSEVRYSDVRDLEEVEVRLPSTGRKS